MKYFKSHGFYCAETALRTALSVVDVSTQISAIIGLTAHQRDSYLWPVELAAAAASFPVQFQYFVKPAFLQDFTDDSLRMLIESSFGPFAQRILEKSHVSHIRESCQKLRAANQYLVAEPTITGLENLLQDYVLLGLVNSDNLFKRADRHRGHYILIECHSGSDFTYYDPGPDTFGTDKKLSKEDFLAWSHDMTFLDYGIIAVKKPTLVDRQ